MEDAAWVWPDAAPIFASPGERGLFTGRLAVDRGQGVFLAGDCSGTAYCTAARPPSLFVCEGAAAHPDESWGPGEKSAAQSRSGTQPNYAADVWKHVAVQLDAYAGVGLHQGLAMASCRTMRSLSASAGK